MAIVRNFERISSNFNAVGIYTTVLEIMRRVDHWTSSMEQSPCSETNSRTAS